MARCGVSTLRQTLTPLAVALVAVGGTQHDLYRAREWLMQYVTVAKRGTRLHVGAVLACALHDAIKARPTRSD